MHSNTNSIESKLQQFRLSTKEYIHELKESLVHLTEQQTAYISFFTYSFNIAHHLQTDNICLASYHIQNIGDHPITNPEIVLTLSDECPFSFHGKYMNAGSNFPSKLKDGWVRLNDPANVKEYRLKTAEGTDLLPGGTLTFPAFQIIWKPSADYSGSVTGITYSDQVNEGIASLNAIHITGTLSIEEDFDE